MIERQIIQTYIDQKTQPPTYFKKNAIGDGRLFRREFERIKKSRRFLDRKRRDFGQCSVADANIACFLAQAGAVTVGTARVAAILRKEHAHVQLVFFRVQPIKETAHAAPVTFSIDDRALLTFGKLIERQVERNLFRFAELTQFILGPYKLRLGPWLDCSFAQGQSWIRNHQIEIETNRVAESLTRRTGAEGIIKTEQTRLGSRIDSAVIFAFELLGETKPRTIIVRTRSFALSPWERVG